MGEEVQLSGTAFKDVKDFQEQPKEERICGKCISSVTSGQNKQYEAGVRARQT